MFAFLRKRGDSKLSEALEELKSDFRRLRIEWEEVLESLERRAARIRASERHERAKLETNTPERPAGDPAEENGVQTSSSSQGRLLTPRQQQIQQIILRRRAGMTP